MAVAINHPGPRLANRRHVVPVHVKRRHVTLPGGTTLMQAVSQAMDESGFDSAMIVLDGLRIGPYNYVMPAVKSPDGRRAAWYSETHSGDIARLEAAVATVGRRDGAWFLHCHAVWDSETDTQKAGHLLPDQVIIAEDAEIVCLGCIGGRFDVTLDPETEFPLFRPFAEGRPAEKINGAIICLSPFEDVGETAVDTAEALALDDARLFGIGSLIGADFEDATPMESSISEVLLLPGARPDYLPTHCVDPDAAMFRGTLRPGQTRVCVTFEMMVVDGAV